MPTATEIRLPASGSDDKAINNSREEYEDDRGRILAADTAVDGSINDNSQHEPFTPSHNKASSSNALVIHSPSEDSRNSQQLQQQRNRWGWSNLARDNNNNNNSIGDISDIHNASITTNYGDAINASHVNKSALYQQNNNSYIPRVVNIEQKYHPLNNTQVTKQIIRYNNNKASTINKREKNHKDSSDVWLDEEQKKQLNKSNSAKRRRISIVDETIQVGNVVYDRKEWINQLQNKINNAKGRGLGLSLPAISGINQDFNEGFSCFNDEDSIQGVFGSVGSYNGGADLFITRGGALLDDTSTQSNSNNTGNHDMDMDDMEEGMSSSDTAIRDDKGINRGGDESMDMLVDASGDNSTGHFSGTGSGDCRGGAITDANTSGDDDSFEWGTLTDVGIDGMGRDSDEEDSIESLPPNPIRRSLDTVINEDEWFNWGGILYLKSYYPVLYQHSIEQAQLQQQRLLRRQQQRAYKEQQDELLQKYSTSSSNQIASHELYEAAPEEVMPKYLAERARSSRSTCVYCYSSIEQGSVRVGLLDEVSGGYMNYCHLGCWVVPDEVL